MGKLISFLTYASVVAAAALQVRDTSCTAGSITSNGRNCTVSCGLDHAGGDYTYRYTANFQTCIDTCAADQNCATAQYSIQNSNCYLKNFTNPTSYNSGVNSVVCKGPSEPPPGTDPPCQSGTFTTNGRSGALRCGVDHPGGDYASQYTGSLVACESLCASDPKCLTAQYVTYSQWCYLKSAVTPEETTSNSYYSIDSIVFNPTVTPAGCMPYAPISPFMYSPGLEQGYDAYRTNGWVFNSYGSNPQGKISTVATTGTALEGCNSYIFSPSTSNDPKSFRNTSGTIEFNGLQISKTYNISVKVGTYATSLNPGVAPLFTFSAGSPNFGATTFIAQSASLCGWTSTGACPIQGVGNATGQMFSAQVKYNSYYSGLAFVLAWPSGAGNYPVVIDDVQIVLA